MALPKLFQRIFWHNNTTPAINEDNLNAISKAVDDIDNRVITLGDDVLEVVPQIQAYLEQAEDLVEALETLSTHPPYIGANGNWWVWNTSTEAFVDSGVDASITVDIADITMIAYGQTPYVTNTGTDTDPVFHLFLPAPSGINNIAKSGTSGLVDTYTITFDDGTTSTFFVTNGKGIVSITKTGTSGLVDTYTITYTNGNTSTFTVTNGQDGAGGSIDALTDTNIDTQTLDTGDVLIYDATSGKWVNGQVDIASKMDKANPTGTGSFSLNRGSGTTVGNYSFAEGYNTSASGVASHAEGNSTTASGSTSHAEGYVTVASSNYSHAEGRYTEAKTSEGAHAEGCGYSSTYKVVASGKGAHAEGVAMSSQGVLASGEGSHAEGCETTASGNYSHAEGYSTTASGSGSHAECYYTTASGDYSHAEGGHTTASGDYSHAEGYSTTASGPYTHAGGVYCTASKPYQFVQGGGSGKKFNSAMPSNGTAMFGFQPDRTNYSSDTTITNGECGCGGCISGSATVTIELEPAGMYLLVCASFTASSGAGYGSTVRMITALGTDTGTPVNLSLGQTSNAPATIGMAANEKITIKNSATTRVTEFHLIRIL